MGEIAEQTMAPTPNVVFVKEAPYEIKKNKFEYVSEPKKDYVVTSIGSDVTVCEVGDYVLFNNFQEYKFRDQTIIKVNEDDIHGVAVTRPSTIEKLVKKLEAIDA
jgi:hypothetical protein